MSTMTPVLEFVVKGTPASGQHHGVTWNKWKQKISDHAKRHWKQAPTPRKLKSTLIHFHRSDVAPLDNDNMAKPVHDAMDKIIFEDDRQLTHTEVIQVS